MSTLALYVKPAGTVVHLTTTPNAQVITYVVFVRKWVQGISIAVATWHPAQLEHGGASVPLGTDDGYDLILKAEIRGNPDTAAIDPQLSLDGAPVYTTRIPLPAAEGQVVVREWSIVIL